MGIDAGDVDIKVEHCEVTLTGTVDNRQDKRRLEDLAESVSGVKHVHNQLRVEERQRGPSRVASLRRGPDADRRLRRDHRHRRQERPARTTARSDTR